MTWQQVAWSNEAHEVLKPALAGDDEIIKHDVEVGSSNLYQFEDSYCVIRLEQLPEGIELVLVAGAGKNPAQGFRDWLEIAKQNNFKTVRLHTSKKGIGRMAQKAGFLEVERVYKVSV